MTNIRQLRQITEHGPDDGAERNLLIDHDAREVTVDGEIIELTATEFDILAYLDGNVHQVVTYREVILAVWGDATYFDQHALEVQVSRLRAKLGESGLEPYFIKTVRGYGYRFKKDTTAQHLASIHYDADMGIISSWVMEIGELTPPSQDFRGEEDWIAQWLDPAEVRRITSSVCEMFEIGLREASGDFMTNGDSRAREKVHVVAVIAELDGEFDGIYAEFFTAAVMLDS